MSNLAEMAERFAAGEIVLVGDETDRMIFLATAVDDIGPERLSRLQELGRGMVVVALAEAGARRLKLPYPGPDLGTRPAMRVMTPVDAADGISGGWSLRDRALTMRLLAARETGPLDLAVPGHVHPACVHAQRPDAAPAALQLSVRSGRTPAAALCAVVDAAGAPIPLSHARSRPELASVARVSSAELHTWSVAQHAADHAVSCRLPTRAGEFRAIGYTADVDDPTIVAFVHGHPTGRSCPLVHVHVSCLLGDVFGSMLCDCRRRLDAAAAAIARDGAGVIVYVKTQDAPAVACHHRGQIDASLAAGVLRLAGVERLRLIGGTEGLAAGLRKCGLEVAG